MLRRGDTVVPWKSSRSKKGSRRRCERTGKENEGKEREREVERKGNRGRIFHKDY